MAQGRRWVGGIGSGRIGGGPWGWVASCSHAAQCGRCVSPSKGLGAGERVRLHVRGPGSAGLRCDLVDRLGQPQCNMMQSHRNPRRASW